MKTIYESILIQSIQWEGSSSEIMITGEISDRMGSYSGEVYLPAHDLNKILGILSTNGFEIDMDKNWNAITMPDGEMLYFLEIPKDLAEQMVLPFSYLPLEHKLLRA
jgi:hypothetical protein